MPARPHQIAAKAAVIENLDIGCRRQIVSMATGTGKTYVFGDLYKDLLSRLPGKMLVLAHTEELVDQNIAAIRAINPTLKVDKEMAEHKADPSTADIIVASVASLGRKGTSRVNKYNWDEWDKVIVDEAHHTPATSYINILKHAGVLEPHSHKLLLGVTATTQRTDGKALSDYYERISYVYGMRQAIDEGWLVDIKGYRVNTETNLDSVAKSGGDLNQEALANKINNPIRNAAVVQAWQAKGEGRQTVVFAANIAHAQALAQAFSAQNIGAYAIWGNDPDRHEKLKRHSSGEFPVLINVGVLIEGYDDWSISCILLACPTQSECKFTQMCGRGTRLQEGTGNLLTLVEDCSMGLKVKKDCIVIDVVDSTSTHSLMTLPSLMGLPKDMDLNGGSAIGALKKLEEAQEKSPEIDFSKLTDIENITQFVENVNLFEVRFPAEVEANSDYKWYKTVDGGYHMVIPGPVVDVEGNRGKKGFVNIHNNLLGKWEIEGTIKDMPFHGIRNSMEEAFVAADNAVRDKAKYAESLINRKSSWMTKQLDWNSKQAKLLMNLYPGKSFPQDFTKGQASFWIDKKLGKKK